MTLSSTTIFLLILGYRIYNALLVKTFFSPDEYWQSLEVAHEAVFGFGYLTWEWLPSVALRGFAHPALFAGVYWLVKVAGGEDSEWIIVAPKLLQAFFAALGDMYTYKLAKKLYGGRAAKWAMLCTLISFFNFFCAVRTFSNSIEASMTAIAMYFWPWSNLSGKSVRDLNQNQLRDLEYALVYASIACILRPTNAIIWMYLGISLLIFISPQTRAAILLRVCLIGATSQTLSTLLDTLYYTRGDTTTITIPARLYHTPKITVYNFMYTNLHLDVAAFYGTHATHWYISQGLPVLFLTLFPLLVYAGVCDWRVRGVVGVMVGVLSLIGHKEERFGMGVLPIGMAGCGWVLSGIEKWSLEVAGADRVQGVGDDVGKSGDGRVGEGVWRRRRGLKIGKEVKVGGGGIGDSDMDHDIRERDKKGVVVGGGKRAPGRRVFAFRCLILFLIVSNAGAGFYFACVHQRGVVDVMKWLRVNVGKRDDGVNAGGGVLFLMPCHSTPYYAHLHRRDIEMRFLTCEPPLDPTIDKASYQDESDVFYKNASHFVSTYFSADSTFSSKTRTDILMAVAEQAYKIRQFVWPSHVVLFDALLSSDEKVGQIIESKGYRECARFFNSHFHDDPRRRGDVVVKCHFG